MRVGVRVNISQSGTFCSVREWTEPRETMLCKAHLDICEDLAQPSWYLFCWRLRLDGFCFRILRSAFLVRRKAQSGSGKFTLANMSLQITLSMCIAADHPLDISSERSYGPQGDAGEKSHRDDKDESGLVKLGRMPVDNTNGLADYEREKYSRTLLLR